MSSLQQWTKSVHVQSEKDLNLFVAAIPSVSNACLLVLLIAGFFSYLTSRSGPQKGLSKLLYPKWVWNKILLSSRILFVVLTGVITICNYFVIHCFLAYCQLPQWVMRSSKTVTGSVILSSTLRRGAGPGRECASTQQSSGLHKMM